MTNSINKTDSVLLVADDYLSRPEENEFALRCPECNEATGLHIDGVVVENAAGQRLQVDTHGEDRGARLNIQLENDGNHDGRRHQLSLSGWCEHCRNRFSLGFKQHKGFTYYSKTLTGDVWREIVAQRKFFGVSWASVEHQRWKICSLFRISSAERCFRHCVTCAHEPEHVLVPDDDMPRDAAQERGADEFAAALLATTEIALLISNHVGLAEWDLWARFWVSV